MENSNRNTNDPNVDAILDESIQRTENVTHQQLLEKALARIAELEGDNLKLRRDSEQRVQLDALREAQERRKPDIQVPTRGQQIAMHDKAVQNAGGLAHWRTKKSLNDRLRDAYHQGPASQSDIDEAKRVHGGKDSEYAARLQRQDPQRYAELRNIFREL